MGYFDFDPDNYYNDEEDQDYPGLSPEMFRQDNSMGFRQITPSQQPQHSASDILESYANRRPHEEDYSPSIWRKLGATLIGAISKNPYQTAHGIVEAPYIEALKEYESERPIVSARANAANQEASRAAQTERFNQTQNRLQKNKESEQENSLLKNSMQSEERAMRESRYAERDKLQEERQRQADERAAKAEQRAFRNEDRLNRADKRSEEYHQKRMKGPADKEFENKDTASAGLREAKADEQLHNLARKNVVTNPMFSDYFDVSEDDEGNKKVNIKPDLPPELHRSLMKQISDEYERLYRGGRKVLPKRVVNDEGEE